MKYYPRPNAQKKSKEEMERVKEAVDKIWMRDYGKKFDD